MTRARPVAAAALALAAISLASGCASGGSEEKPDPFATAVGSAQPADDPPTLGELEASGPAYTPFDEAPILRSGAWLSELLADRLVPVIDARGLGADTRTLVWGLVAEDGSVRSALVQTTSGDQAFDEAAVETTMRLQYEPARRGEAVVPVWILINVSMLLR